MKIYTAGSGGGGGLLGTIFFFSDPQLEATGDTVTFNTECKAKMDAIGNPTFYLTGGDHTSAGTTAQWAAFDDVWSGVASQIHPCVGNHDKSTISAYDNYWNTYQDAADHGGNGTSGNHYYVDVNGWRIVITNIAMSDSATITYLESVLDDTMPTLVVRHWPAWNAGTGHGSGPGGKQEETRADAFWQCLYDYKVEALLSGHEHVYQRFARINRAGNGIDTTNGVRQFVAMSAGDARGADIIPGSGSQPSGSLEAWDGTNKAYSSYGFIQFRLYDNKYDWQTYWGKNSPGSFNDSGTQSIRNVIDTGNGGGGGWKALGNAKWLKSKSGGDTWVDAGSTNPSYLLSKDPDTWTDHTDNPGDVTYAMSTLDGGGYYSHVDVSDPAVHGAVVVLAGGDTSAFSRSTDLGKKWTPVNNAVQTNTETKTVGFHWSPSTSGLVYGMTGSPNPGDQWNFWKSTDHGKTWTHTASAGTGSGLGLDVGAGAHPRWYGRNIAEQKSSKDVYAGSNAGVRKSTNGASTFTTVSAWLSGRRIKSMVFDAVNDDILYVAVWGDGANNGVYAVKLSTGDSYGYTTNLTDVLELQTVAMSDGTNMVNHLYVGAGTSGVRRFVRPYGGGANSIQTAGNWTNFSTGLRSGFRAGAIDVRSYDGGDTCVVLVGHCDDASGTVDNIYRSTNGGSTWSSDIGSSGAQDQIYGTTSDWYHSSSIPRVRPDGSAWATSGAALHPTNSAMGWISGKAGCWVRSSGSNPKWQPAVRGIGGQLTYSVACHPTTAGKAIVATADWGTISSTSDFTGFDLKNLGDSVGMGHAAAVSSDGHGYIIMDPGSGMAVYHSTNPWAATPSYTSIGSPGVGSKPGVCTIFNGSTRYTLAAGVGTGIWRSTDHGSFSSVYTGSGSASQGETCDIAPDPSTAGVVYHYSPTNGLLRSTNYGGSWSQIANITGGTGNTYRASNKMQVHPSTAGKILLAVAGKVYYLTGCDSGTPTTHGPYTISSPGVAAVVGWSMDGNTAYCIQNGYSGSSNRGLWKSTDTNHATWTQCDVPFFNSVGFAPMDWATDYSGTTSKHMVCVTGEGMVVITGDP